MHIFATFEEMIGTPELQAVIVASATPLHLEHSTVALDRGMHVLCEKPVCKTVDEVCHYNLTEAQE